MITRIHLIALLFVSALGTASAQLVVREWPAPVGVSHYDTVAAVGDVDADGVVDVAVAFRAAPLQGTVHVYSGASGQLIHAITAAAASPGDLVFGSCVSSAGDVDADGCDDVAITASGGGVEIRSGLDGSVLLLLAGGTTAGDTHVGIGDLDGDGFDDVLVGDPRFDLGSAADVGRATVFSGFDGSILHQEVGQSAGVELGRFVGAMGDLDADGAPEFAISLGGRIGIWSGIALVMYRSHPGLSAAPVGFFDADGRVDLVVAGGGTSTAAGSARVYSGSNDALIAEFVSESIGDGFGHAVAVLADLNDDGVPEIAVAAPGSGAVGTSARGRLDVFSGSDGFRLIRTMGRGPASELGRRLAALGDVNGDGFGDLLCVEDASTPAAARAFALSPCGAATYGEAEGIASQTLAAGWAPGPAGMLHVGSLAVTGAAPGSLGVAAVGRAPTAATLGGTPLLVDPTTVLAAAPFPYDATGSAAFPTELRRGGRFTGLVAFVQFFEVTPIAGQLRSSPGVALGFCR